MLLRFGITGILPNAEGMEEPDLPHSTIHICSIFIAGCLFAGLSIALCIIVSGRKEIPLWDELKKRLRYSLLFSRPPKDVKNEFWPGRASPDLVGTKKKELV